MWALELLFVMKRKPDWWSSPDLVLELRGSDAAIADALQRLKSAGFVVEDQARYRYQPATHDKHEMADQLQDLYGIKPLAVVSTIANAPNRKLQIFSDAFRIRKD